MRMNCLGFPHESDQDEDQHQEDRSLRWRECKLRLAEICGAELVPDALLLAHGANEEVIKCAWLRSQIIGSQMEIATPFGKRRITYADYTASGRCLLHVENFLVNHVMPHYGNVHTVDSYVGGISSRLVHESCRFIKQCLGGSDDDALLFCGSGTTAAIKRLQDVMGLSISSVLRERFHVDEANKWVVFVGPYEHHSNLLSWRQSCAEVVDVPMDEQGMIDLDFLEEALENPLYVGRPKLGSFSACSNVSGIVTNTRAIARLLHQHGAFACFDFASSGPYVEIDMRSSQPDGFDAIFLSPHKFVGGPGTPGLLLMNKKLYFIQEKAPTTVGGGVVNFVNGFSENETIYLSDIEEREDAGTPQILQTIKAALAFWIKEEMGTKMIHSREQSFIKAALKRLAKNPNVMILGNTTVQRQAILSFLIHDGRQKQTFLQARFVVKLLSDLFGIQARGGCSCAGPYGHALLNVDHDASLKFRDAIKEGYKGISLGWCRVNFAYFLSDEQFEFIVGAIEFIAKYGECFVPWYDFDWESGNWTMNQNLQFRAAKLGRQRLSRDPSSRSMSVFRLYLEEARVLASSSGSGFRQPVERRVPEKLDKELINFRL